MLRSAATVLLASAPLFAAAPARAAVQQQDFPCAVGVQKADSAVTSAVTVSIRCQETQTVGVTIAAGDVELARLQQTVEANVQQSVTLTVPRVPQVCATLRANGESTTLCTPAAASAPGSA
ncbi:hypothetical protein [Streptomyces umbrinus]|nr:hypothetical protein [Streptomyces umbrinus]